MEEENYRPAGWAAFASAVAFMLAFGLLIYDDLKYLPATRAKGSPSNLLPIVISLDAISKVFLIYAWLRFRTLLNKRYAFHAVDTLIVVLIIGGITLGIVSYLARVVPEFTVPIMVVGAMLGIALGILGIVYATRLLRLNGDLNGMLKPLAYTYMAASICFAVFILAPLGLALNVAATILLGVALMKGEEEIEELEVV
jgi:hypothetical protein